jgi:hypothetical protein
MISLSERLSTAIIIKGLLEIILLSVVATIATLSNFHPGIRGAIDIADSARVAGWAADASRPREPVEVQLFIDGHLHSSAIASGNRPDLVTAAATPDPAHGFVFSLASPPLAPGRHTIEVFVRCKALSGYQTLIPLSVSPVSITTPPLF